MAKHILVISQYYHPEPFRITDICAELVRRGYRVTVLTGIPNYPEGKAYPGYGWFRRRKEVIDGVEVIRIPLITRGHSSVRLALNYVSFVVSGFFWQLFTRLKADHVFTFEVSPMTQALIGVWYAKRHKIPHTLYVQDLWPENVQIVTGINSPIVLGPIGKMVDYIYRNCTGILGTSPSFVAEIQKRVTDKQKVSYWPQYAEEFYTPQPKAAVEQIPDDGRFKLIFTGNIGKAQGLDILPETAHYLKTAGVTDVCFVIVGGGRYKEQLLADIADCNADEMFLLVDRQPAAQIPSLLAACDSAFLSFMDDPLFEKTIPAKLQSYMACAMPVVAAAKGETERLLQEANCGICTPIGDAKALAEGILAMKTQADLPQLGANARAYFEKNFEKQLLMDRFQQSVLEELT